MVDQRFTRQERTEKEEEGGRVMGELLEEKGRGSSSRPMLENEQKRMMKQSSSNKLEVEKGSTTQDSLVNADQEALMLPPMLRRMKEKLHKEDRKTKQKMDEAVETAEEEQVRREHDPFAESDEDWRGKSKGKKQKQNSRLKKKHHHHQEEEGPEHYLYGEEDAESEGVRLKGQHDHSNSEEFTVLQMGKQKQKQNMHTSGCSTRSMFSDGFKERRDLEQYFWSEKTVLQLTQALQPTAWHSEYGHVCCLAAPSLAHAFYTKQGRAEVLLDIDTRFAYLPGFRYFDICKPGSCESDDFRIVVFDPPFFYIPLPVLFEAVLVAVNGNLQAKLLVGFLRREERSFLQTFAPFHLRRTGFVLEYATVKPNKWRNYGLYANIDLPGIKRIA